jgi:hypothetical protein
MTDQDPNWLQSKEAHDLSTRNLLPGIVPAAGTNLSGWRLRIEPTGPHAASWLTLLALIGWMRGVVEMPELEA